MSTAIQKVELPQPPARAGRALIVSEALTQESEQRKLLGDYVRAHMIEGTDYGVVPGTANKTLLKPGAEKLTQLYRCVPRFVIEDKTENWDTGLFYYRFSCQIVTQADDAVVAEGVGSCSTFESRYRWRNANRVCPACGKEAIIKGKAEFGGGWVCFKKKDGCGAKFGDDDAAITEQKTGRVQNPDLHDQVNTVLKMAKKRALVDAAIALARCSDIFTQDMDDAASSHEPEPAHEAARPPQNRGPSPAEQLAARVKAAKGRDEFRPLVDEIRDRWNEFTDAEQDRLNAVVAEGKAALNAKPAPKPKTAPAGAQPPLTAAELARAAEEEARGALFDNDPPPGVPHP
jgi:hypothetical protein